MFRPFYIGIILILLSCNSTLKIKDGRMAYEYKKYALAIDMLKEELDKNYKEEDHFLLADAYARINRVNEALNEYGDAIGPETSAKHLLDYAFLLKRAERYGKAINVFQMLKTESDLDALLDKEIAACLAASNWLAEPDSLTRIERGLYNSPASDYHPILFNDQLYFTSDRSEERTDEIYEWTGAAFSDIWVCDPDGTNATPLGEKFNTRHNEGTPVFSSDGREMYFTRCFSEEREDAYCRIMYATSDNGSWSKVRPVENLMGAFNVKHPALSMDDQLLFFASDATNGYGGMDLYFCRRTPEGWSNPVNLGQNINGEKDEVFPFLYHDTLYFSSESRSGMGGLDIYYTYFNEDDEWVAPINMQTPFNSGSDDFGIWIDTSQRQTDVLMEGYFSSDRPEGAGRDDIYGFSVLKPEKPEKKEDRPLILTVKVVRPVYRMANEPNSGVRRYVPLDSARVIINETDYQTDITGIISHRVDSNGFYRIKASADGYLSSSARFSSSTDLENGTGYVRLVLPPVIYNTEIVLQNIYYDFNKWDIREDARPALDSLVHLLNDNPDIQIQLSSHTDCRGDDAFNEDLSQKRATSAIQYLIANGIDPDRLTAVGYGEQRPFIECPCAQCTEEEHQANRRTSFTILE